MRIFSSLLAITLNGVRMARHVGYSAASVPVYRLCVMCHGRGLYICLLSESNGPNMLDKPLKGFIANPADLPWKGVKRLATSGERVNHDSWVKMYNLCRVLNLVY